MFKTEPGIVYMGGDILMLIICIGIALLFSPQAAFIVFSLFTISGHLLAIYKQKTIYRRNIAYIILWAGILFMWIYYIH